MHVLIIPSEPFTPDDLPLGGIFQKDLADALYESGIKVGVISIYFKSLKNIKSLSQVEVLKFKTSKKFKYPVLTFSSLILYSFPKVVEAMWLKAGEVLVNKYIKKFGEPDIIHAHNSILAGKLALIAKRKYNIKYIVTEHYSGFLRNTIPENQLPQIREVYQESESAVAVSRKLAESLNTNFHIKEKIHVVPNLIDTQFENLILPRKSREPVFTFLNVARMDSNKGQEHLLKAFSYKFSGKRNVQLKIGGDGELKEKLKELSAKLNIEDQVTFLGELSREEVKNEMLQSNAFVLTSNRETFGVVLIEAMACGNPIISTNSGGPNDIITHENGILAECNDPTSIANAMEYVYLNIDTYDPIALRKSCLESFGRANIIRQHLKLYKS